jgi:hypothetical protein
VVRPASRRRIDEKRHFISITLPGSSIRARKRRSGSQGTRTANSPCTRSDFHIFRGEDTRVVGRARLRIYIFGVYIFGRSLEYHPNNMIVTPSCVPQEAKHRQVFRVPAAEIGAGKYRDTGRLPSESQLVIRFGVSRPPMVRALWDLRVVVIDGVHHATVLSAPLTTIHQPYRDIAAIAFGTMLSRTSDPAKPSSSFLLAPHWVIRKSCGAHLSNTEAKRSETGEVADSCARMNVRRAAQKGRAR